MGQVVIMGDHEDGLATGNELAKEFKDRICRARVEVARRLIGNDNGRVVGHGPRNGGALLLPAGDGGRQLVGLVGQINLF